MAVVPLLADCADERDLLALRIQQLFKAQGFLGPNIEDCVRIAVHVERVRNRDAKDSDPLFKLAKRGLAFLKELAGMVDEAETPGAAREIEELFTRR